MSTIKEVAAKAGVSVTTVSRTLNNRGYISKEMRERIRQTMAELNYQPNEVARSLTNRNTKIIGVLLPLIDNPFFSEVASELSKAISRHNFKMMLYTAMRNDDRAPEYVNMLKANQVDGMIVCFRDQAIEAELSDDLPAVSFERLKVGRLPTILCDNEAGGRLAARTLIDGGCKKPAMIGVFHSHIIPAYERLTGFLAELRAHGMEERFLRAHDEDTGQQYDALAQEALERYPDTDGFFCSSDLLASHVMRALLKSSRRIPDDVQLIGFNSNRIAETLCPRLTSIRQPVPDMCEAAVNCIIQQISGESIAMDTIFPVTLDVRESTKPAAASSR